MIDVTDAQRVDDNLVRAGDAVACGRCGHQVADLAVDSELQLARYDAPSSEAGPGVISDPSVYVDDEVVFRQLSCPGCHTAIYSGVVPKEHVDHVLEVQRFSTFA